MAKEWYIGDVRETLRRAERINRSGLSSMPPAVITCAITGGMHGKEANPNLPVTIEEQVQATWEAYQAGASVVHIHTRDPATDYKKMSTDYRTFQEVNARIREKCPDIIINNTYVGNTGISPQGVVGKRMCYSGPARPEMASLDITAFSMPLGISVMTDADFQASLDDFAKQGIKPELECFNLSDIKLGRKFIQQGKIEGPFWWQIIWGGPLGVEPAPELLFQAERMLPENSLLSLIGIGAAQTPFMALGLATGHHVRVGLEDNVYYHRGVLAEGNAQLVERAVRVARDLGRPVATPAQAREMLGLGEPRQYSL